MKRVDYIILHGCPPNPNDIIPPEKRWMNWLADQLEEKGFKAVAPEMPNSWNPQYEEWKEVMNQYQIDKSTILIGHSCACAFLIKWLLESRKKIKSLYLLLLPRFQKGTTIYMTLTCQKMFLTSQNNRLSLYQMMKRTF